jgi:hypothetical protein
MRQDQRAPLQQDIGVTGITGRSFGGETAVHVMVEMQGHPNLPEFALTFHPRRGFPRMLNCRQQQTNQDADNRDHDYELQERKAVDASDRATRTSNFLHGQALR